MAMATPLHLWLLLGCSVVTLGSLAFFLSPEYGVGLLLLSALIASAVFWIFFAVRAQRMMDSIETAIVDYHPKVLSLLPASVAKTAARRQQTHRRQVNNYLTGLAQLVDRQKVVCNCCGAENVMLKDYPFDPHFHDRSCEVVTGWQEFGNPEICPWGLLFQLPQPVLLGRLSQQSITGLAYFATKQAETFGYDTPDYYKAVGTEYLRHYATDAPQEFVERLGRRILEEYRIVSS